MRFDTRFDAKRERLVEDWANLLSKSVPAVCDLAGAFRQDEACYYVSHHCGSFNFSLRLHWEDGKPDWLIRFPIPGKSVLPEDKVRNEVALMNFLRQHTSIPKDTTTDEKESDVLDPDISEDTLKTLYSEISKVLLELWSVDWDKIGAPDFDTSNSWRAQRPPVTLGMNEFIRYGGLAENLVLSNTFSSSLDYFMTMAELHSTHLKEQLNRNGWSLDPLYWNLLDNYVYGKASITERVARTTYETGLHGNREPYVRSKIEDLQRYNEAVASDECVDYEEPAEDETPEYWIKSDEKGPPQQISSARINGSRHPATGFLEN
ncbi:predicted protein [Uncinocarpus reesii 1704]|uniref:Aminoglycoside phosphotransferase domain-containing protein n=1 Tax=Uncinocarpus reesii (strain UAMH 1704) TaxID=336963 RepID=C4JUL9_UNCRE|nr:uncharacterized protein UREG_04822 [Uncinocarpus reesii 1704]EEP79980.1 predicted protein [Uncinocarpus reesii 1704]